MNPAIKRIGGQREYYFEEGCYIIELSNSPADPDVSIARARVQPGRETRLHRLLEVSERYVILEGEGYVEVEGLGTRETVGPGDVVIIPPGGAQRIANTGKRDLLFLVICSPRFTRTAYVDLEGDDADQAARQDQ